MPGNINYIIILHNHLAAIATKVFFNRTQIYQVRIMHPAEIYKVAKVFKVF